MSLILCWEAALFCLHAVALDVKRDAGGRNTALTPEQREKINMALRATIGNSLQKGALESHPAYVKAVSHLLADFAAWMAKEPEQHMT